MINVPKTEGIKYAGSKLKLLPHIINVIKQLPDIHTVLDGFSGTTRVSQSLAQLGYDTTSNDISIWSETFGRCYLLAERKISYYQEIINHLNYIDGYNGWFSENYGGADNDNKKPFQLHNTQKLDAIRDEIEKLNLSTNEKSVILTSLILALDKCDSTLGHFSSYLSKWSQRSYNTIHLMLPNLFDLTTNNNVIRDDIFNTIKHRQFDLAYFDPPYGSNNEKMPPSRVRYDAYYHFWKTVILNDKPQLFGKVNRREDSKDTVNPSVFESFKKDETNKYIAIQSIEKLIKETKARYILLSYSSGGRATKQELLDVINSYGNLQNIFEIDYKKNVMSNMCWTNKWSSDNTENKEFLFLLKK